MERKQRLAKELAALSDQRDRIDDVLAQRNAELRQVKKSERDATREAQRVAESLKRKSRMPTRPWVLYAGRCVFGILAAFTAFLLAIVVGMPFFVTVFVFFESLMGMNASDAFLTLLNMEAVAVPIVALCVGICALADRCFEHPLWHDQKLDPQRGLYFMYALAGFMVLLLFLAVLGDR